MISLRLIQKMNGAGDFGDEFLTAVYHPIVD